MGSADLAPTHPCEHCALSLVADAPVLAAVATLCSSTSSVSVSDLQVSSLIDSGSTTSFIHPEVVKSLNMYPSKAAVILAASQISITQGHCFVDLTVKPNHYPQIKLPVLPQLCSRIILGANFMEKHQSVEFTLKGILPKLTICRVACTNTDQSYAFLTTKFLLQRQKRYTAFETDRQLFHFNGVPFGLTLLLCSR